LPCNWISDSLLSNRTLTVPCSAPLEEGGDDEEHGDEEDHGEDEEEHHDDQEHGDEEGGKFLALCDRRKQT